VIVCAYTMRRLPQLLASLAEAHRQLDLSVDELVLVVDHNDELAAHAAQAVPEGTRIVPNTQAPGLSGARNSGVAATSADAVVFVDDDAVLRPGAIAALRERLADPDVVAVGGAVHARWEGGRAPRWFPDEFGWVVGCDYRGLPGDGAPIRNPIGACMAVRRPALDAVGGFSAALGRVGTLPVGCEETLMGIEVRRAFPSTRIVRDERFAVDHLVPADRQTVRYFLRRCFHEGRSKALLSRAVGAGAGLSSERSYVLRTLSAGVARSLRETLRGDLGGLGRAGLIALGLTATVAGLLSAAGSGRSAKGEAPTAEPATAEPATAEPATAAAASAEVAEDELVSVVVCTLGRDPRLVGTVAAVLGQTHADLELVVVDNDPASGRVGELLAGVDDARLRIVPQPIRGLSAARNAGLDAARGALIAYTDDDAVPDPTWIAETLAVLRRDRDGDVACVTGRVVAAETVTREQEWFEEAGVFDKGLTATVWSLADVEPSDLGQPGEKSPFFPYTAGEMGSGNNMLFRAAALRALGGFDEALGAGSLAKGGEDLDIFRRVILAGSLVVYTPDAVVRHYHRDTYEALRQQMYGYGVGMSAVLTKLLLHGGKPALGVLRSIPRGVHMLLAPSSKKNAKKPPEMPSALVRTELLGYLAGPVLYVRSVGVSRRRRAAVEAVA
jgi:GT2 family glycosyltransferase